MKKLPIDVSTFSILINEEYLYVDKTEVMYDLITQGRYYFLTRPRRFGKSLFISTLRELYAGNRDLFKDLWIGTSDYDWKPYPVLYLDFSNLDIDTPESLRASLSLELETVAQGFDIDLGSFPTPGTKLKGLIRRLGKDSRVVILIDEYDFPLINNLDNTTLCAENRKVLKSFFSVLKSLDSLLQAIFITGVTKFSKTSLFSGLNTLNDISMDPRASQLLGYTHEEVRVHFEPYITAMANKTNRLFEEIVNEMVRWYDGYRFSEKPIEIFNPFSVLYYLKKERLANYWLESGTPEFLLRLLEKDAPFLSNLDSVKFSEKSLGAFDIEQVALIPLLFQTGYLTVHQFFPKTGEYQLGYPNAEISEAMRKYLLVAYSHKDMPTVERTASLLSRSLMLNDLPAFFVHLQTLFAGMPYHVHLSKESYYHSLFQLIGTILNLDAESEIPPDKGRIDCVLKTASHIYLFELKLDTSPQEALAQIERQKYYERYRNSGKQVVLVGVSFSTLRNKLTIDYAHRDLVS